MKTIHNKTHKPLRIHLHGGKVLHLAPTKSGQISDEAVGEPSVRKLVEAGEIEIVGEDNAHLESAGGAQGVSKESQRGHAPNTVAVVKGNRGG